MIEKAYKFRAYPNVKQKELMDKTFGCSRYVFNFFLDRKIKIYEELNETLNYSACSKELTSLKQEFLWLKEVDKFSLQNSLRDLDTAYKNFFSKKSDFPKFKSKKFSKKSYRTSFTNNNIRFENSHIVLPKLGSVKIRDKQVPEGRLLNATISKESDGRYYISLCYTDTCVLEYKPTNKEVGIDLGIKDFCVTSDLEIIKNHKHLNKSLKKLAKLQRELSRKQIGSNNRNKARLKVARLHSKIKNQRKDFLNKLSTYFIKNYDVICIEDLDIKNMLKDKDLSRHIGDVSWSEFVRQLTYKSKWYSKKIVKIDKYYPSSQICSNCNYKNKDVKSLEVRAWECSSCKITHDRDINASKNILKEGLRTLV